VKYYKIRLFSAPTPLTSAPDIAMAKYKAYSYSQGAFIPVYFGHLIHLGTFKYT
jgi:hypothetical protein